MMSERGQMLDIFDQGTCSVCTACEINQYFNIDESYLDYNGTFYSLREVLKDALDLQILSKQRIKQEICLDCKDKVVKFFHFKRKAKEIQMKNNSRSKNPQQDLNMSRSTIVHNIVKIVKNYSEKCPISKIRIDEMSGKLIIESHGNEKNSDISFVPPQEEVTDDDNNFINVKEELTNNEILQEADESKGFQSVHQEIVMNEIEVEVVPASDIQHAEDVQPAEDIQPIEDVQKIEDIQPAEDIQHAEDVQPAEDIQPLNEIRVIEVDFSLTTGNYMVDKVTCGLITFFRSNESLPSSFELHLRPEKKDTNKQAVFLKCPLCKETKYSKALKPIKGLYSRGLLKVMVRKKAFSLWNVTRHFHLTHKIQTKLI